MEKFTFKDRPDVQRFKATLGKYPGLTSPKVAHGFITLQWTYREMQKSYDKLLAKYDLSESKFIILMFLKQAENQQLLPSEIADKLGASRATVTKMLNKMNSDNWIRKQEQLNDKRAVAIKLLPKGNKIVEKFLPANFKAVEILFSELSSEELEQFLYLLNKVQLGTKKLVDEMETLS